MSSKKHAITTLLQTYRTHLTASNAPGCAELYTPDGCTMAQNFPTQVGIAAVKNWYELVFSNISLDVEFVVQEVVVVSGEWAFARTTSKGTQTVLGSGVGSQERNQELFVLRKGEGGWRIARYCCCTMNEAGR